MMLKTTDRFRVFLEKNSQDSAMTISIGLLWFLIWPTSFARTLNIVLLLCVFFLFLSRSSQSRKTLGPTFVLATIMSGTIGIVGIVSSVIYGDFPDIRLALIVGLVVGLGVVIGLSVDFRIVAKGLLIGTTLTVVHGWLLLWGIVGSSSGGRYSGITGSEPYEFYSVLIGLGSTLVLLRPNLRSAALLSPFLLLFLATTLYIGLIAARLTTAVMLLVWGLLLVLQGAKSRRTNQIVGWTSLGLAVLAIVTVTQRPISLGLARVLGDEGSLEARYQIWDAVLQSVSPSGLIFGYGVTFWEKGSPLGDRAREIMLSFPGNDAHNHAHNAYLDFLVSFGVIGALLGLALAILFTKRISKGWYLWESWDARSAPWVYGAGLATLGLVESAFVQHSAGWLFLGSVLGAFVFSQPSKPSRSATAGSVGKIIHEASQ
jgi:O-antigen ligase